MPEVEVEHDDGRVRVVYGLVKIDGTFRGLDVEQLLAALNEGLEDALRGELARQVAEREGQRVVSR